MDMIKRKWKSLMAAANGIYLMRTENHFGLILLGVIPLGIMFFYFPTTAAEKAIFFLASSIPLGLEMVNTAIEHLADKVDKQYDELIKNCKDLAAGSVLFSTIIGLIVAAILLMPYLLSY
tara:strand:+ start:148055 stop:148414 length:360 start_codon:yes stop_codon:yes gene_type:complete